MILWTGSSTESTKPKPSPRTWFSFFAKCISNIFLASARSSVGNLVGVIGVLCILFLAGSGDAWAVSTPGINLEPNPSWCQAGFRCLRVSEYEAMTVYKIDLEHDLRDALRNSGTHFGFGCSVGPSIAAVVDENLRSHTVFAPLSATCGITVRFTRRSAK